MIPAVTSGPSPWPTHAIAPGTWRWQPGPSHTFRATTDLSIRVRAGEVWLARFAVREVAPVDGSLGVLALRPAALVRRPRLVRAGEVAMAFALTPATLELAGGPVELVWKPARRPHALVFAGPTRIEALRKGFSRRDRAAVRARVLRDGAAASPSGFAELFLAGREAFDDVANLSAAVNHFLATQGDLTRRLVPLLDETHRLGALSRLALDAPRFVAASVLAPGARILRRLSEQLEIDTVADFLARVLRRPRLAGRLAASLTAPTPAEGLAGLSPSLQHRLAWSGLVAPWFDER